jgi:hypothetical protein
MRARSSTYRAALPAALRVPTALACLAFALSGASCSAPASSSLGVARERLLAGSSSDAATASAIVAIVFDGAGLCSGVLVAPRIVLTAASCLDPTQRGVADQAAVTRATRVLVDANDVQAAASGQFVAAAATVVHPQYEKTTFAHDVGVVLLATPVSSSRIFAVLHTDSGAGLFSAEPTLWGFGQRRLDGGEPDATSSGVLTRLTKSVGDCAALSGLSNAEHVCFDQTSGGGICDGDTGGPTILTDGPDELLIGLHAFQDPTCSAAGVDARVSAELDFLGGQVCVRDGACVLICGTLPLPEDPDCAGAADDAGVTDGASLVDGGQTEMEDASADAAPDASMMIDSADQQGDAAAPDGGSESSGGGCGCRVSPPRGGAAHAAAFATGIACLLRRARLRRRWSRLGGPR